MGFSAPLWLILLAPWAALGLWLIWSRRHGTPARVPFIELWRGSSDAPRATRRFSPPPIALIAILAAMLLSILGAARPELRRHARARVMIVIDRGITMSAGTRLAEVLDIARKAVPRDAAVTFVAVPEISVNDFPTAANLPTTALDTSAMMQRVVAKLVDENRGLILALTDHLVRDDPRVMRIVPSRAPANVSITRFAVREHPTTQAMITVRNDSPATRAELTVENVRQSIDLPPAGQQRSFFADLPAVGEALQARLDVRDDFDGDNIAYLARQRAWPKIELRGSLAPEIRRVVEAYQAARPASDASATVAISASVEMWKEDQRVVIAPLAASPVNSPPVLRPHPIAANLNSGRWTDLLSATPPSSGNWTPVIISGDAALLSVRERPVRQVWIGFTSPTLARMPDFVILWTNILDWVASASDAGHPFAASEVGQLSPDWKPQTGREHWPGFYQRSDGAIAAANAPDARFITAAATPAREQALHAHLVSLMSQQHNLDGSPYLFVAAAACALVAAAGWPRAILTPFSPARTV